MDKCLFCRIASGEVRSEIIYEDDQVIGLTDICPIRPGHTQIIPREHLAYFEDLPGATASRIIHLGQRLSRAMKALYGVPRVAFLFSRGDPHSREDRHYIPTLHRRRDAHVPRVGVCAFRRAGRHSCAALQQTLTLQETVP